MIVDLKKMEDERDQWKKRYDDKMAEEETNYDDDDDGDQPTISSSSTNQPSLGKNDDQLSLLEDEVRFIFFIINHLPSHHLM